MGIRGRATKASQEKVMVTCGHICLYIYPRSPLLPSFCVFSQKKKSTASAPRRPLPSFASLKARLRMKIVTCWLLCAVKDQQKGMVWVIRPWKRFRLLYPRTQRD